MPDLIDSNGLDDCRLAAALGVALGGLAAAEAAEAAARGAAADC
jgi:hypothetical protein